MEIKKNEKKENNIVEMEIAVGKEEFADALQKAYTKVVKNITVPGFRKGKAPRKTLEKLYGEGILYDEAIRITYPEAYYQAVVEAKLEPVDEPEIEIKDISSEGYTFSAKITVKPEVTLGEYKGLKAEKQDATVTDEDVENEINRMADRNARLVEVDREVKDGDTVVLDFEGFVDGVAFDGGKGEKYTLKIGSHQFIDGFEEQLIGKQKDTEIEVNVKFPDEYHAKELQGKDATFKCLIHEISETVKPEINDEFAKDVSEFETLAELKADLRKKMEESKQLEVQGKFEDDVMQQIMDGMKADIPEAMYKHEAEALVEDFARKVQAQGMDFATYLKMNQMDRESAVKIFRPQAERHVKARLALEQIAKLENITVSEEEIQNKYNELADMYKIEADKIKNFVPTESISEDLTYKKAIDFVCQNAVVTSAK